MKSVLVGMSGGVDSAVAALLLKKQGYRVVGYTLKFGEENNKCCKVDDARLVSNQIGIEYLTIDIYEEFEENIIQYFIAEYLHGKTPSPCPICNLFKFGVGLEYAQENGIDFIATGHYATIENGKLYAAPSPKDQAYFLSRLSKNIFDKILLPLGEYSKDEIREIAKKNDLIVANKKDSQDICFVENDYRDFLKTRHIKPKTGEIINVNGDKIGEHLGIWNFTVGQRFRQGGLPQKMYITAINATKNQITIGKESELFKDEIYCSDLNLLVEENFFKKQLLVKVRSRDEYHPCVAKKIESKDVIIKFDDPIRDISAGQLAVLYHKVSDEKMMVVGSGWIEKGN